MITRIRMGITTESALTEKICWAFIKSRRYIARISDQRKTWQPAYVVSWFASATAFATRKIDSARLRKPYCGYNCLDILSWNPQFDS